jgi:hypothetical protein
MDTDSLAIARWQFRLAWGLADEVHLRRLTDDACLWLPHPDSWTVRDDDTGRWVADWVEPEPMNAPPPSIAWLTWHMLWWWSGALSTVSGGDPGRRDEVYWPGTTRETVTQLRDLASRWEAVTWDLDQDSLARPTAFPWPDARPLIYTIAWVPLELMKNIAEIGEIVNMYTNRPTD